VVVVDWCVGHVVTRQCDAKADAASCTDPDFTLTKESYSKYWEADVERRS
jgi:hypothetical protein